MIIDHLLMFTKDEGQAISSAADSEYRIDFGQKAPTTGMDSDPLVAVFTVKKAVTGTLTISLQDSDSESSSYSNCAVALQLSSPAVGTQVAIPLPRHHKRYMQAHFDGSISAGTVHGFITTGLQDNVPPEQAASLS